MRGAEQKEMTSDNHYYLLLAFEVITARERLLFMVKNYFSWKAKALHLCFDGLQRKTVHKIHDIHFSTQTHVHI